MENIVFSNCVCFADSGKSADGFDGKYPRVRDHMGVFDVYDMINFANFFLPRFTIKPSPSKALAS